ncbi:MAG: virulence protein, partial [Sphingorhabdus sp.]
MPRTRVPERLEKRAREIVEALDGTWSRSRGMCCCPAHDDQTPSLSVTIGVRAILFH